MTADKLWLKDYSFYRIESIVKIRNAVSVHDVRYRIRSAGQGHAAKPFIPAIVKTDIHSVTHFVVKRTQRSCPHSFLMTEYPKLCRSALFSCSCQPRNQKQYCCARISDLLSSSSVRAILRSLFSSEDGTVSPESRENVDRSR